MKRPSNKNKKYLFLLLIIITLGGGSYFLYQRLLTAPDTLTSGASVANSLFSSRYSAIFLDNNDVYFGKITKRDSSFITLENTFYLRVTQVAQKDESGKEITIPSLNLVKVGAELHKPKDKIELQITHIIFIQELDPTSEVIKVINNYKTPA